jgi:DNA-binding response OmpR family regulator
MRLLVIEDDVRMADLLRRGLEAEGHSVAVAHNGAQGLRAAESGTFDALVLDVMLPQLDGFQVARRLRAEHNQVPIVMLTARDAVPDMVRGLDLGADDYITKPFSFEVLVAKLRAIDRRQSGPGAATLRVGNLLLDTARHEVTWRGQPIDLTKTEFQLLEILMRRAGRVVPREDLIEAVWGAEREVENNTLDVFLWQLRRKVRAKLIRTVRGIGYVIRDRED